MKRPVKIQFRNGLTFESAVNEILNELTDEHEFIDSDKPDFIVFGPYGHDVPPKGDYVRIGYFCEAITPDLEICEWAFGIPQEETINNHRYKRIQWHGLDPHCLVKNIDVEKVYQQKTKFCNYFYSNPIAYRDEFFTQLSQYKHVDAPGTCMNNMPAIEKQFKGAKYDIKRQFLLSYKFTVAFESYVYPGYQTEKLYDAMRCNSIPIYCGDPLIAKVFNPASIINAFDYIRINGGTMTRFLERFGQYNFRDYLPATYSSLYYKVRRKLKTMAKAQKMRTLLNKLDFAPLIDRIKEVDNNPEIYKAILAEPWFKDNRIPEELSSKQRWVEIFDSI